MNQANIILPLLTACSMQAFAQDKPNVIVVYIDDMGYSDLSCYGGDYTETANIDRIAAEGIKFNQYYSACPISSPSRTGITTGMYPTRWGITTFLDTRAANANNEQNDFLSDKAPSMARAFKNGGYHTGHFGKWHMGGGRDVKNAPSIANYGFDEFNSTWESPNPDPELTSSNWIWANTDNIKRWNRTAYFVDKTLAFLEKHKGEPCFVNLWPDDVHTPWVYEGDEQSMRESAESFTIVLKELDVQIGRLMQGLKDLGIDENTIVVLTSDNGPAPAFDGHRTNQLRGQKGTLYEGGIRMPFMIRWPGKIQPGQENSTSVLCSVDLFPSLCAIAGNALPTEYQLDGIDMSQTLLGKEQAVRTTPIFWEFGKTKKDRVSPHIAVREGKWKLLVNADGSRTELYDMDADFNEKSNLASTFPAITAELKEKAISWFKKSYREYADHIVYASPDGDTSKDGSSWENATTISNAAQLASAVSGAQVWLKSGVYNVEASVNIDNVKFYGGFAGTEEKLYERDWKANPTIIDGGGAVSPMRNSKLDASVSTVVDGVIIQNGLNQAGANGNGNGGGMILANGAVVRNCIFRNNKTQNGKNGAALHCHLGNIRIENTLFVNNQSAGNGGAVQVGGSVTATFINCTLANNKAAGLSGGFGLGNNTSNLNVHNTIAYNNVGKNGRNSFAQNANINDGGTVVSKYSAIESASTKFSDGDDVGHIVLTEEVSPAFANPSDAVGNIENGSEISALDQYSYELAEVSPCIDAGNANLLADAEYDLNHAKRLSGAQIDMGAYEVDKGDVVQEAMIIRAATDGTADSDGSSWESPATLPRAIELASTALGDAEIWLKAGLYTVDKSVNIDNIALYGGFSGTETSLNDRNWNTNQTIIDGGGKVSPLRNNSLEASVTTVVDGLIIQNGINQSGANGNGNGGGMILANGAVVRNCIFRNNKTQNGKNGAALHCHLGNIRIENSLFINNQSSGNGGAIQVGGGVTATVINCTFANNKATGLSGCFGLGNNTSNLNVYNTIAYNNIGKNGRNSFAQNADINGGGTVISKFSAIESASTKFSDGNDEGHLTLSETESPMFSNPATIVGYANDDASLKEIELSSYTLQAGSPCIDAGDDNYASVSIYDLARQSRVIGLHVDMGAYETPEATNINKVAADIANTRAIYSNGKVMIRQTMADGTTATYNTAGALIERNR